jgi:hypothetical protein
MRPAVDDVIRAVARSGITSPNEKVKQYLFADGYEIPTDFETLLAEAVKRMLVPPISMVYEPPPRPTN